MIHLDQRLIAPTRDELEDAVGMGLELIHRERLRPSVAWSRAEYDRAWERTEQKSEGSHIWGNASRYPFEGSLALRLTWWSDFLRRRHVRLELLSGDEATRAHRSSAVTSPLPLFSLYPQAGFVCEKGQPITVCPCGAIGTVKEIAWMGTECGPCHDRRQCDELPARLWDAVTREYSSGQRHGRVWVVGSGENSCLLIEDPAEFVIEQRSIRTNEVLSSPEISGRVRAVSRNGEVLLNSYREIVRVSRATAQEPPDPHRLRHIDAPDWSFGAYSESSIAGFSPSGRYLVMSRRDSGLSSLQVRDLEDDAIGPYSWGGPAVSWVFAPDESRLYLADETGRVQWSDLPFRGPWHSVRTNLRNLPDSRLHPIPGEALLVVRQGPLFGLVDVASGRLLHREERFEFESAPTLTFQSTDGRCLVGVNHGGNALHFLTLPDFTGHRTLRLPTGPVVDWATQHDHWLVVGNPWQKLLIPWEPLLEWYEREQRSQMPHAGTDRE